MTVTVASSITRKEHLKDFVVFTILGIGSACLGDTWVHTIGLYFFGSSLIIGLRK